MATGSMPEVPMGEGAAEADAALQRPWRMQWRLSRVGDGIERFLANAGFDRGPWVAVALIAGIACWFVLDSPWQWLAAMGGAILCALAALAAWREDGARAHLRVAIVGIGLVFALGVALIWTRSAMVGAEPIERPGVATVTARVLEREEQPADGRVRLVLAMRDAEAGVARKMRVNLPLEDDRPGIGEGAVVRLRARLMPPAPPMLPGAYNFARRAWFDGYAATGSTIGEVEIVEPASHGLGLAAVQRSLSAHVRDRLDGSPGTIAAAFASGDRGAIAETDEEAMRDAGLTHLLSISGLHVSAVIAAAYLIALKLMALWPWLALRIRLPIAAAGVAALAGIGYTLLTGAEVPTVRSCVGALLVLLALALGREPLVGPSFQMSFAAVLAIVALHTSGPVRSFLGPRDESWPAWFARRAAMLLLTGLVIEIALMPIVLFHFHRAGVYGAFANVLAIPLVTFVSMPLIAFALLLDTVGAGAPVWWLAGKSLELLLAIAHWTAAQPGAVKLMPQMSGATYAIYLAGGLWLALWSGRARLLGLAPAAVATAMLLATPVPDVLVSGDGRHVGIAGEGDRLLILRESRSDYARDNLLELAGMEGEPIPLEQWPGARCSRDFCAIDLERGGRSWSLLMARSRERVEERALAAACERADIVVADRWLPRSCRPRWLKADRNLLERTGGLAINLETGTFDTVTEHQGEHGWWRSASPSFRP
jgi:competence protein ComEC